MGYPRPSFADSRATAPPAEVSPPAAVVKVNRTVPRVEPPKTALEFSARPTPQEIFRARVFEEPLVPIGAEPAAAENAALAAALLGYSRRAGPDDFSSLTAFLEAHPHSPWRAALLTDLGLEYYNTAHYSLALEACGRLGRSRGTPRTPKARPSPTVPRVNSPTCTPAWGG